MSESVSEDIYHPGMGWADVSGGIIADMLEHPRSERSADYDHDVTMRYDHYATANRTSLTVLKSLLKEQS